LSKQPTEEEAVNALVVEIRVLEGTYNELTSRQNLLERALLESRAAIDAVNGVGDKPPGEVLVQIGGGAMLRSPPPSTESVLVSVGSGIVLEKPKAEAVAILEERVREVEKTIVSVLGQRTQIAERLDADRQALNSVMAAQGPGS
jgi:prefoldin alpha subunit